MRDSESIFDQVVAFSGADLTYASVRDVLHVVDTDTFFHVTDLIQAQNTRGGFELADNILRRGYDIQDFLGGLEEHFRNILVVRSTASPTLIEAPEDVRLRYEDVAQRFTEGDVLRLLRLTAEAAQAVRYSAQPRLKFEVALVAMIRLDSTVSITDLLTSGGTAAATPQRASEQRPLPAATPAGSSAPQPSDTQKRGRTAKTESPSRSRVDAEAAASPESVGIRPATNVSTRTRTPLQQQVRDQIHPTPFFPPVPDSSSIGSTGQSALAVGGAGVDSGLHDRAGIPAQPPHPLVQLLIDGLGAAMLPARQV